MKANQQSWTLAFFSVIATLAMLADADGKENRDQLSDSIEKVDVDSGSFASIDDFALDLTFRHARVGGEDARSSCERCPRNHAPSSTIELMAAEIEREGVLLPFDVYVATVPVGRCSRTVDPKVREAYDKYSAKQRRATVQEFYSQFSILRVVNDKLEASFPVIEERLLSQFEKLELAGVENCMEMHDYEQPATFLGGSSSKYEGLSVVERSDRFAATRNGYRTLPFEPVAMASNASSKDSETDCLPSQDDQLKLHEPEFMAIAGTGSGNSRIVVPAQGPAPISLDFAFPAVWDGESDGVEKQYDHPTTPTGPRRDDSNLLATGRFDSMTLPFNR